jgi:hypothetical protein
VSSWGELKHSEESWKFVVVELNMDHFNYKIQIDFPLKLSIGFDKVEKLVYELSLGEGEGDDVHQVEKSKVEKPLADRFGIFVVRLLHHILYSAN